MKRKIFWYDPKLKLLARKLRHNMTFSEVKLWNEIKNLQMMGYDFDRQRPIAKYIVDFYCKDIFLAIEIDGITHDEDTAQAKDKSRQKELENLGIQFIRFNALDVVEDITNTLQTLENWLLGYEEKYGVLEIVERSRKRDTLQNPQNLFLQSDKAVADVKRIIVTGSI